MTFEPAPGLSACFSVEFGPLSDILLFSGIVAIPAVGIPVVIALARRNPSRELVREGRRRSGVRLYRLGFAVGAGAVVGLIAGLWIAVNDTASCVETTGGTIAILSVLSGIAAVLVVGGGWAFAIRAVWVVFATLAILDVWIFYINLLISLGNPEAIQGLLLLAFALHGICILLAARWSFTARNFGPVERAKAGEAGRTLSAVWVFLMAYASLTLFRDEEGIFSTAAGSAVTGALTLGALAVTMGSGYTKYAEAINAKPPPPPSR